MAITVLDLPRSLGFILESSLTPELSIDNANASRSWVEDPAVEEGQWILKPFGVSLNHGV